MERSESSKRYIFGPYTLETSSVMLLRGSKPVPLTRKRYEILLLLVENAGQVMAKEEIIERIWPDQFVEEANLANNIHALRRLIESPSAH
ncbi:MAG: Transcriptional regulator HilA [Acidobacteriota bacterium]